MLTIISIIFGLVLIALRIIKKEKFKKNKFPSLLTVLRMFLYAQSIVYGIAMVLSALGIVNFSFEEYRWAIAFGGIAILYITLNAVYKDLFMFVVSKKVTTNFCPKKSSQGTKLTKKQITIFPHPQKKEESSVRIEKMKLSKRPADQVREKYIEPGKESSFGGNLSIPSKPI